MTNLEIEYDTVHKVKGREADYAVIVDVTGGVSGFPSQVEDDPLLELLLPNESGFPHAEERRLFYVALTRARRQTFVLTSDAQRSVFIEELEGEGYAGLVSPPASVGRLLKCAICEGGRMVSRSSEHGEFLGCSNYPLCESKAIKCPSCDRQTFVRQQKKYVCGGDECDYEAPICPQCGLGAIIRVEGPYGPFKGCTEWRSCRGVLRF